MEEVEFGFPVNTGRWEFAVRQSVGVYLGVGLRVLEDDAWTGDGLKVFQDGVGVRGSRLDLNSGWNQIQDVGMELRRACRGSWVGDGVRANVCVGPREVKNWVGWALG